MKSKSVTDRPDCSMKSLSANKMVARKSDSLISRALQNCIKIAINAIDNNINALNQRIVGCGCCKLNALHYCDPSDNDYNIESKQNWDTQVIWNDRIIGIRKL